MVGRYYETLQKTFENYTRHAEAKMSGDKGWLKRKRVVLSDEYVAMGKESNSVLEQEGFAYDMFDDNPLTFDKISIDEFVKMPIEKAQEIYPKKKLHKNTVKNIRRAYRSGNYQKYLEKYRELFLPV